MKNTSIVTSLGNGLRVGLPSSITGACVLSASKLAVDDDFITGQKWERTIYNDEVASKS